MLHHVQHDESILCLAGWWQHYDIVEWMLGRDADPDLAEEGGNTLLINAAAENDVCLVRLLLDHGADIEKANGHYETPLGFACAYDSVDAVRLLCESGANVNGTEGRGHSYLFGVQCAKQAEIESILLAHGARVIHEEPKLVADSEKDIPRGLRENGNSEAQ